jgi:hypothetical protein
LSFSTFPLIMNKSGIRGSIKGGHSKYGSQAHELKTTMNGNGNVSSSHKVSNNIHKNEEQLEQWPRGLANVGNTCYANAALQCLLSTALTNALLDPNVVRIFRRYSSNPNLLAKGSGSVDSEDEEKGEEDEPGRIRRASPQKETEELRKEREKKKMQENCDWLTTELTHLTQEYTTPEDADKSISSSSYFGGWFGAEEAPYSVLDPGRITRYPNRLSKCLSPYQQEDAHEFLRSLLSTLVMNGANKQLSSLFDGLLESSVVCQTCGNQSLTRDRYMDLSLDINDPDITTLDDALYQYTKTEVLENENAVFCAKCDEKQSVTKGLRLATAPTILVCHLKRFAFNQFGQLVRLHKKIKFPKRLEISDHMSQLNKATPPPYDLVGILVHQGQTCDSGHYLAYVKKYGCWYKCNDSAVTKVDEETALDQQAYILLYEVAEMRAKECSVPISPTCKNRKKRNTEASGVNMDDTPKLSSSSASSIWNFFFPTEGHLSALTDICCAADGLNEPRTRRVKHRSRRRNSASSVESSVFHNDFTIIEVERNNGGRSSTAPRQRDCIGGSIQYEAASPSHSDTHTSKRKTKKIRSRSKSRRQLLAAKELPPLPNRGRRRRAKSNGAIRFKGGYIV